MTGMRVLPLVVLLTAGGYLTSCSDEDKKVYAQDIDTESTPTMTTVGVSTLISDSGIVRYKVEAPVWYVYDEAVEPKWTFPQSLHLESFDEFFNKDATIDCDSATYLTKKQLWRLDGHVKVVNMAGEKFLTNQLFWDQKQQKVYSDSFIQVIRADRIMEGHGFVSNEQMTDFSVRNVSAILPAEMMNAEQRQSESARRDSVQSVPVQSTPVQPEPKPEPVVPTPQKRQALPAPSAKGPVKRLSPEKRVKPTEQSIQPQ